jgi:hypothetical protein
VADANVVTLLDTGSNTVLTAKQFMEREFNNKVFNKIIESLKNRMDQMQYEGDISDLGNEIGYAVGKVFDNMKDEEIKDFTSGFKHGVSLTNGTH